MVFAGATVAAPLVGVTGSENVWSFSAPAGVGGGEINATFLCVSELVAVTFAASTLPDAVLRDGVLTIGAGGSGRGEVVRVAILNVALLSCERIEDSTVRAEDILVETEGSGSPMGGSGLCALISGSGLKDDMELGVDVTRVVGGGHSGSGGSDNGFSLGVVEGLASLLSLAGRSGSFSLVKPLLKRWKRAFIVNRRYDSVI